MGAPFGWSPVRPSPRCAHSTYPGTTSRPRLARNTPATTDTSLQVCSTTREDFETLGHIEDKTLRVYAAMIQALDRSVGRVLEALDEHGLTENTW